MTQREENTMTAKQVCEYLGISMATLNRRVALKELAPLPKPAVLIKHHERRFDRATIEAYKAAHS